MKSAPNTPRAVCIMSVILAARSIARISRAGIMKKTVVQLIIVMLLFASQASAAFFVGNPETFESGFSNWVRMADTEWKNSEGGYARVGKDRSTGPNLQSSISNLFIVTSAGTYEIEFDYRFVGFDNGTPDDILSVVIDSIDETLYSLNSQMDLSFVTSNFNSARGGWTAVSCSVDLEPGVYDLTFELMEAVGGAASTEFDVDNIAVVPEPATLLLCGLGCIALRKRKR